MLLSQFPLTFQSSQRGCSFSLHSIWLFSCWSGCFCDYIIDVPGRISLIPMTLPLTLNVVNWLGWNFCIYPALYFGDGEPEKITGASDKFHRNYPSPFKSCLKHLVVINIFCHTRIHRFLKGKEILKERYSCNYSKDAMPKFFSIKLRCNFIERALWHGCYPINLLIKIQMIFFSWCKKNAWLFAGSPH